MSNGKAIYVVGVLLSLVVMVVLYNVANSYKGLWLLLEFVFVFAFAAVIPAERNGLNKDGSRR